MKYLFALSLQTPITSSLSAESDPPNIVLIFIDDMGWKDAGYAGSDLYETPNIDRLASEGMVFTDAYAAAGNCQPSRACLISGQYTPRHGIYAVRSTKRGPVQEMRLEPVPNTDDLPSDNFTIAEAMQSAGYATGMFGKWHLGKEAGVRPQDQGFDVVDTMDPEGAKSSSAGDPKWIYRITDGACDFIEQNRDRPFFLYVSHHATHMGIQANKEMFAKFPAKEPGRQHRNRRFAAMNCQMDDGVGKLLDKLDELNLSNNTLVVFTSDNGGLPQSSQGPLRGFKGMYYEGGIRVPMVARWPSAIEPGSRCSTPVINVDLYPTFLAAAGHLPPEATKLDGESLLPLLSKEGALARNAIFWHFPGYLDHASPGARDRVFRARPQTVIRQGDWKLKLYHEEWLLDGGRDTIATNRCVELFNLSDDIGEQHDLSAEIPSKRDELLDEVLAWHEQVDAKLAGEREDAAGYSRNSLLYSP